MTTTSLTMRDENARETFFDIMSILAVALVALVLLVATNPRIGHDVGTLLRTTGTQSAQVTSPSVGR